MDLLTLEDHYNWMLQSGHALECAMRSSDHSTGSVHPNIRR